MELNRRLIDVSDITEKEEKILRTVMSKYNFQIVSFSKVRSAYKVKTTTGDICLKKLHHGRSKAVNGSVLVEELRKNNFCNTAKYYKTKEGTLFTKYKSVFFYATEWIDGEECRFSDINEAIECVKLLARFHITSKSIDIKKLKIKNNLKNWLKEFNNNINDLEKFKKMIERKKIKNEFDIIYMDAVDHFYNRGMIAVSLLNSSKYYQLSKLASENKTICHDSFYYQNIIKKGEEYFIIDLDSIKIDLQVNDLGKLIRRLMFKTEYEWDFNKAKALIEEYSSINKLSKSDLEVMLALIVFPHKFWKLGRKRYVKHKSWNEAKYLHKINKLIKYDELQEKFLENYLNYIQCCE